MTAVTYVSARTETTTRLGEWILALFLLGTIVDYGGGFYVKQTVFAFTIAYMLAHRRTYAIWLRCLADITIVILLPALITLGHLILTPGLSIQSAVGELWIRLGSPAYFLVVPIICQVGARQTAKWIVGIMAGLALATVVLMVAHVLGWINIFDYTELMVSRRVALFGSDTRATDLGLGSVALPGFGAAQAFPAAFSLSFAFHPALPLLIAVATVVGTQRGQVIGLALALLFVLGSRWRRIPFTFREIWRRPKRGLAVVALMLPVIVLGIVVALKSREAISLLLSKYTLLISGQDESSSIRAAHFTGYWQTARDSPMELLWGVGPRASFYNAVSGDQVFMTEMVVLIYAFWYGWLYTVAFYAWIGWTLYRLFKTSRDRFDAALFSACAVLVIVGNINPVMLTPLAFIFLALLRARRLELGI